MQITIVGDEIRVDGASVGVLYGGPRKEREALRDALRDAPDVIYEGGSGSFVDDDLAGELKAAEREADMLREEVDRLSGKVDDAATDIEDLRDAMVEAAEDIKHGHYDDALKILSKAVDE